MLSYNQTPEVDPVAPSIFAPMNGTLTAPASANSSAENGTTVRLNNPTINYCFLESHNWPGVDVATPDCSSDPNNTLCTDPDAANRIVSSKFLPH